MNFEINFTNVVQNFFETLSKKIVNDNYVAEHFYDSNSVHFIFVFV